MELTDEKRDGVVCAFNDTGSLFVFYDGVNSLCCMGYAVE